MHDAGRTSESSRGALMLACGWIGLGLVTYGRRGFPSRTHVLTRKDKGLCFIRASIIDHVDVLYKCGGHRTTLLQLRLGHLRPEGRMPRGPQ